jgi:hypothetical protein
MGHQMLAHLRTEAYPVYASRRYPPPAPNGPASYERNLELIAAAKAGAEAFCGAGRVQNSR